MWSTVRVVRLFHGFVLFFSFSSFLLSRVEYFLPGTPREIVSGCKQKHNSSDNNNNISIIIAWQSARGEQSKHRQEQRCPQSAVRSPPPPPPPPVRFLSQN
ncbi:hypothetical protein BZA05DRAFT_385731 [Tricharina praecox]|uniref:uncharacterized protein n=1 Tax=Tricharina praecox TaxID=43433 RepID=UPI00221FF613|nr:uncharacterized protein BZA05DRAFT_385731 [Tricharina praecox]KAI5858049.1 hypothetical protein BZA05DRAFT_385731 [Tricharina praecox]